MKLYVYNTEKKVVAIVNGESNEECEIKASDNNYDASDDYGWTYSPAFGMVDGLVETEDAEEIE